MALFAFGTDAAPALSELDTVDLEAIALSHAWGLSNGHTERVPPSPCARPDCHGSVLIWDGERYPSAAGYRPTSPAPAPARLLEPSP
jgi:hypothetical protein